MSPDINMVGDRAEVEFDKHHQPERVIISGLTPLNPAERYVADTTIQEASQILGRPVLPSFKPSLYRKYQKVSRADSIYAFGILEVNRKEVRGSQGWSVQMAIQLGKNVYVYDDLVSRRYVFGCRW